MHDIATDIPAPVRFRKPQAERKERITVSIREAFEVASNTVSILVDWQTKNALLSFAKYRGWKLTTQKEGDSFRVWRIA